MIKFQQSQALTSHFEISTVWKFNDFSITQILREINFDES